MAGPKADLKRKDKNSKKPQLGFIAAAQCKNRSVNLRWINACLWCPCSWLLCPLLIASTSDRNRSFEGKSLKVRQGQSLGLFYIRDTCYVLAVDNSQGRLRQIMSRDSKTQWVYPKPHLHWFHDELEVWLSHRFTFAVGVYRILSHIGGSLVTQ